MKKIAVGTLASLIGLSAVMTAALPGFASAATFSWGHTNALGGGGSVQLSGSCATGGAGCTRTKSYSGPEGATWTRNGTLAPNGDHAVTFTAPTGRHHTFKNL